MSFVFPTNASQVQAFAGALFGVQVGTAAMTQVNADILANGGLTATLNGYYSATFSSTAAAATAVATNLGLTGAALTEGTAYVTAQLNAAAPNARGAVISNIANMFGTYSSDATFGAAATAWKTKVATAASYTGTDNVAIGSANPPANAGIFTLTANLNIENGASGDDSFSGGVGTIDSDVLTGGGGNDSLTLTLSNADDNNAAFTASGIEHISLRTTGAVTLDLGNVTGVEELTANRLAGNLTLNDVQDIADIVVDRNSANADLTVTYAADVVSGTADEITVTVSNSANVGTVTVDGIETVNLVSNDNPTDDTNEIQIDAAGTGTATEVLNISGSGDLTVVATDALTINNSTSGEVELTATAATTINNSGSGDITITATAATAVNHSGSGDMDVTTGAAVDVTIDAASATGSITVTANGAGDLEITGSAQADTFEFAATLTNEDTIDGGDGADTLQILGDEVTSVAAGDVTVSNVETIEILGDTNADTLDFDVFSSPASFSTVIVTATDDTDDLTLADVQASTYTIRNAATGAAADDMDDVNIDLKVSTGTADAITVNIQNRQLGTVGNQADFVLTTLEAAGVERITLNATRVSTAGTAEDVTITNFTTVDLESLTLTGNADLTISSTLDDETVTINAADFTGALDVTVGSNGVTYTGGSGADTVRFGTRLTTTDTVTGGAGSDTVVATLSAGTVAPTLSGVETLSVNFNGGALSGANLGDVATLTINTSTTAGVASNLTSAVTTINQQDDAVSLAFNYVTGAAAVVTMNFLDTDAATIANTATQFSNVSSLTIAGGNGVADNATVDLGSLSVGAATSLTITSDADTGDTLDTGDITGASLTSLTVTADDADITVGTVAAANLGTLSLTSTGAGDVIVGAITAGNDVTSVVINTGTDTTGSQFNLDDITATDSDIATFSVTMGGNYGASDIDTVVADNINTLTVTTSSAGTSLDIEAFNIDESIGSITFRTGDDFTIGAAAAAIDTGATGTIGNITIVATDTFTAAADGVFINDALTVGNISVTSSGSGTGVNLGRIDEATTVGNITIVANDDVEFDGADAATTVGDISVTVAEDKTVDMNDAATGTTGGVIGTITASGAGSFTLQIGAVTSMGTIDLSGLSGTSDIALSNTTEIGVVATLGSGDDTFAGTGGADVITAGEGADSITGRDGADSIDLTEETDANDVVVFGATTEFGDTITGFDSLDDIDFNVALLSIDGTNTVAFEALDVSGGAAAVADGTTVVELVGDTADDAAAVAALIAADADIDAGDKLLIIAYTSDGDAKLWYAVDASGADWDAAEMTLVGTLTGITADSLVTGQFV